MGRQEQQSESIMGHTTAEAELTNQVPFFQVIDQSQSGYGHTRSEDGLWHPLERCVQSAIPRVMTNEEGIFINIKLVSLSRLLAHKLSAQ